MATAGAAVVTAVTANPSPAFASGWTVTPAGAFTATSTEMLWINESTQILCRSSVAAGTLQADSADGAGIGSVGSVTFDDSSGGPCSGPLGSTWAMTTTTPWTVDAEAFDPGTGVTSGTVTGVAVHVAASVPLFGPCTFDLTGTIDATYTNATSTLSFVSGELLPSGVTGPGCGVMGVSSAQHWSVAGDYDMSPGQVITFS